MRVRRIVPSVVLAIACAALAFVPGPRRLADDGARTCRAEVVEVDDSSLQLHGFVEFGTQHLKVRLPDGRVVSADNELRAQMELDKKFAPGDTALVVVPGQGAPDGAALVARDHWRLGWCTALFAAFCVLLCAFGGWTGAKALFSFVFSCLAVWKLVVPLCLNGVSPILATVVCVFFLTLVIMFLVAGWSRKFVVSCTGSMLGVISGCVLSSIFTHLFHVNGAIMPYSQALYYSGYQYLSLQNIFIGAIILASSGAVMDLGMDVAAGMEEIVYHKPDIPRNELIRSGIRIGQSVVGTMTTTLLLAYSGGYLTLMMTFAAQGTSPVDFINNPYVASEAVKTLIGSFALVLVAPFTAIAGGIIYKLKA